MFKKLLTLIYLTIFSFICYGQQYGNEWINFTQNYVKITISSEGLYKITYDDIISKNLFSGNLDPNKFQIFNKGIEIPLIITGSQDGKCDQGDEVFFYGNRNDASLDKILYTNTIDLPNSDINLFTNENFYFLTYSPSKNGLRYQMSNLPSSGLTPENYIVAKDRLNFDTDYYPGEYILEAMSLSEYTEGEGYLGSLMSKGQAINYQLNTSNFVNSSFTSTLSFYIAGRSNASSTNNLGKNHHFRISNGSTTLFDSLYRGYSTIRNTIPIVVNTNTTSISLSSIDDLGAVTDFQAPGYLEIKYSRNLSISGINSLSFKLENAKPLSLLNFTNSSIINPIILEKNGIKGFSNSGINTFVIKDPNPNLDYYLVDQNNALKAQLNDINFKNINPSTSKNYLIISHNSLKQGAEAYQLYNQSISMPTSIVYTDDLYNEFYFGFHHPLALRNYCDYMIEKGTIKPQYLLLLGKGYDTPKRSLDKDLVPTMGFPASDNMITSGLNGSNLEPGLATGRIPAKNNQDIALYLEKLKAYNSLPDDLWRKNILQVTGGTSISESLSFRSYQNQFYKNAEKLFFGGHLSKILKDVTTPITENQTERLIKEAKEGLSLVSYFGHGSATGTEISFGKAEDQQNFNKPTIFLVNGCSTGACFSDTKSLGELYILAKDVGAIGWIGTTSEGVASYLGNASNIYYENWFNTNYGKSISQSIKEGLKKSQNPNDKLNRAHIRQYIWLGDPYIKFYSPPKQDYVINNDDIFPTISQQNATSQSFKISFLVKNLGKTANDSIPVQIKRTLPTNGLVIINNFKIKPVYNNDTLKYELNNEGLNVSGNNKIEIKIDPLNLIDETSKANNTATIEIFLPGNGVKTLFPLDNGIFSKSNLILKGQPDDLHTKNAQYLFEIDTISNFSSSFKKASDIITAGIFPTWQPSILLEKNKVYFYRIRLNLPFDKGGSWSTASFTYNPDIIDGYSQSNKSQLENFKTTNIVYDKNTGKFDFGKSFYPSSIYTEGDDGVDPGSKRFRTDQSISFSNSSFEGFTLVAMSNITPNKYLNYPSPFNSTNGPKLAPNGYTGQFYWNINIPSEVDSMIRFINQIPANFYVIGFNGRNASLKDLPIAAKNALKSFGLSKFELVGNGEPYMFWGIKGKSLGTALEFTADYSSAIPPRKQTLQYFKGLEFPLSSGKITTNKIGPSQEWKKITIKYDKNNNDNINHDVYGISSNGVETKLISASAGDDIDISNINAKDYPYLKITSNISDLVEYNVPNLKHYIVDYKPLSELSFDTDIKDIFYNKKISEGDSIKWEIGITNIYDYNITDSISVNYILKKQNNATVLKTLKKIPPLASGKSAFISIKESTLGLVGINSVKFKFNNEDLYIFNNEIANEFEVLGDKIEPIVNVLFDGKAITNGEIVSTKPIISINLMDENKYLLLNDTSLVEIYIKRESDLDFKKVSFSSNLLTFQPSNSSEKNQSIIEFKPQFNKDSKYVLKIRSKDRSGNTSLNDYQIEFEVITESSITNLYPYPNPVVNSMKFVFTLTGSKIPEKMKITIYNSSAKVVKTITKNELGNIKIGNNISDFVWDCKDEFGDRLANGIYFYKVSLSDSEETFKDRSTTSSSKFFKNNMGKIYIIK